jgi:hypothetical protein
MRTSLPEVNHAFSVAIADLHGSGNGRGGLVQLRWPASRRACGSGTAGSCGEERWLSNESRPEVVESILADDFIHVLPVGFIDKSEHLQYLKQHPEAFPGARRLEELRIRIYGDTAAATGIVRTDLGTGSPKRSAFTDLFVRRKGQWFAVNAQELPLSPGASPGS